jgi:hypothetical protein
LFNRKGVQYFLKISHQLWSVFYDDGMFGVPKPSPYSLTYMKNAQKIFLWGQTEFKTLISACVCVPLSSKALRYTFLYQLKTCTVGIMCLSFSEIIQSGTAPAAQDVRIKVAAWFSASPELVLSIRAISLDDCSTCALLMKGVIIATANGLSLNSIVIPFSLRFRKRKITS